MCAQETASGLSVTLREVSDVNTITAHFLLLLLFLFLLFMYIYHLIPAHERGDLSAQFPALCASSLGSYPSLPGIWRSRSRAEMIRERRYVGKLV